MGHKFYFTPWNPRTVKQILIHDCAVALVPGSWRKKRKIAEYIKRTGRVPLINSSTHQHLLSKIPREKRQDRPDLLHFALLLALNYAKIRELDILFTVGEDIYRVDPDTRLPRDQQRFYGILEGVLAGSENPFITRIGRDLNNVLSANIWLFSRTAGITYREVEEFPDDLTMVFGGRAHSGPRISSLPEYRSLNLGDKPLELWTAISLVVPRVLDLP